MTQQQNNTTSEWITRRIGDLGRVVTGKTPTTKDTDNFGGDYPFITIPDLDGRVNIDHTARTLSEKGADRVKSSLLPSGAVMMSCIATVGKCGVTTKPSFTNQQINSVIPDDKTDSRFLYYIFTQLGHDLDIVGGGGSIYTNVSKSRFSDIEVSLPPLPEQRRIAHILGTLDDKIELNRRMNETLDEMARAIFKDWFVDFGPVRAKMEGRDAYLPDDIWKLFPDNLADSELAEIPYSWEVKRLGDCFNLKMGQSPPSRTYNDDGEGLPFFQGKSDFGFRYPDNRKYCSAPNRIAESGDTLVSVRAPVGDINMAWERCCVGRGLATLRHESGSRSFTYYSTWILQHELRRYEHTGTVFGAINKKQFEELLAINPKRDIVNAFELLACVLDDRIESNVAESRTLAAMRDTLLPKLVSGEVRVNT